ncbi:ABC transporter permease DevC [Calothrix sp. PCC 7507]|uniref:ABC transporter permease DevC n=1 Tax=Calothrix sp. PCC 7507 TaxID=99598 RepID=UPI00029F10AE|nr:ABC transporter permease DevC [Calothrix sp. PCC 7507]AFY34302.1 DevC protein [Calothrix sp. PCC 7507]
MLLFKFSLAWINLVHNKQRFITALGAVVFAVLLMFIQLGFRNAMLQSSVEFINRLDADLILTSRHRYVSFYDYTFKKNRLYQVQGFDGVQAVSPLYLAMGIWKNQGGVRQRPIRIFGYNLKSQTFLIPDIPNYINALQFPDTVIADKKSRQDFGEITPGVEVELLDRKVKIIGNFQLGTDFVADGNLITSDQNFLRIFNGHPYGDFGNIRTSLDDVDFGLIKIKSHHFNVKTLVEILNKSLPPDVVVMTKKEFMEQDIKYFDKSTPIGFMFGLGTVIGFFVGIIVVYNIIYTDINNNLPQYGTLRAIGYSNSYLVAIIVLQSAILAIIGFFPGLFASILIYQVMAKSTGLLVEMSLGVASLVAILTIFMCIFAGLIGAKKIQGLDPAEVYEQKR